ILSGGPVYRTAFVAQVAFYFLSVFAMLLPVGVGPLRALRLSTMFAGMNAALALGFWRWLGGVRSGAWERTARAASAPAQVVVRELRGAISVINSRDWWLAGAMAALA